MAAMRCSACAVPGVLLGDSEGELVVSDTLSAEVGLIGVRSESEIVIVGAFDVAKARACENMRKRLEAGIPHGLCILGILLSGDCSGSGDAPGLPSGLSQLWRQPLCLIASAGAQRRFCAWDMETKQSIGPWTLDLPAPKPAPSLEGGSKDKAKAKAKSKASSGASQEAEQKAAGWPSWTGFRGRLSISTPAVSGAEVAHSLEKKASLLEQSLFFRFPGRCDMPTLAQLQAKEVACPVDDASSGIQCVDLLTESLADAGPTNFVDLHAVAPLFFHFDFVAYLPQSGCTMTAVAEALVAAARAEIHSAAAMVKSSQRAAGVAFRCFQPLAFEYPLCLAGTENAQLRSDLHTLLLLPQEPCVKPECAVPWRGQLHPGSTGKPLNPHLLCGEKPGWWKGGAETRSGFVRGTYEYAHYMQDNFDDNGWGCAYRSLQTCISWYRMQSYTSKELPGIWDIQKHLKRIDDAHKDLEVGRRKWIGTQEGRIVLQDYLEVDCDVIFAAQGAEDLVNEAQKVLDHFAREGTPIMMGAGLRAFTMVGMCFDPESREIAFLIVDPHYTGADEMKTIIQKGWVGWKNLDFFAKEADGGFINCSLPRAPRGASAL